MYTLRDLKYSRIHKFKKVLKKLKLNPMLYETYIDEVNQKELDWLIKNNYRPSRYGELVKEADGSGVWIRWD